jgi:anti-anti-sigma factor
MFTNTPIFEKIEHSEATVVRIRTPRIMEIGEIEKLKDALFRLADLGTQRIVLDLSEVQYLSSASLGVLIILRRKLGDRGGSLQPLCRRGRIFAFYQDQSDALEAIRNGETDPLLLCGACNELMELFMVCGGQVEPDSP